MVPNWLAQRVQQGQALVRARVWHLEDVNTNFYNCGHYPEWVVVQAGPSEDGFASREAAQAEATRRNGRVRRGFQAFMNA